MLNQKVFINNKNETWLAKKMAKLFGHRLGQATTEIAVFGTITLVVFGVLLRYGQMYNAQQEAQMYAFRESLKLARNRYDAGYFGSVTLVAMKEYLPVDLFSSEPQTTYATGSTTVTVDERQQFYDFDDPENVPATYYQIGNQMIANNELIQAPYMHLRRKPDSNKAPGSAPDSAVDIVIQGGQQTEESYDTWQSAPFWETNMTTSANYNAQEQRSSGYSPDIYSEYSEASTKDLNGVSTYEVQPWDKIYASDELIEEIYSTPSHMIVEQNQTIGKERSYSAGY